MIQQNGLTQTLSARISGAHVKALALCAAHDEAMLSELYELMWSADKRLADNATWVLTHLPPELNAWLNGHREQLMEAAMKADDATRRRLMLTLVERLPMEEGDVRADFVDFCFGCMASRWEPYGVKALCVKLSVAHCRHYPELIGELNMMLDMMAEESMSPGVRCAWKKAKAFVKENSTEKESKEEREW
ncbi:MAG: hypothetical protein K5893_06945 [Prevotella sp.]|nr:hypothetical protein [Prevotella sp.]